MKPSIPKGTRDFSPAEMARRNFIFKTIREIFERYGFQPIETPAMENLETLMGKYGEEGDKLLFRILNSGPVLEKINNKSEMKISDLTEKGLRYDLTVPFARYVVQHQNEIVFPFRRYQIQPVWRADRPQRGRYREFYQCDADVIGSNALLNEFEIVQMIDDVFTALKIPVVVKINNRKILSGIAEVIGEKERIVDITVAIDKLDKIGVTGVNAELLEKGINETAIAKLQPLILFDGDLNEKLIFLKTMLANSDSGRKGIDEIESVFKTIFDGKLQTAICQLDLTLARGLSYYTGAIFEVKASALGGQIGSICGGGRYDDLAGIFGLPDVSGVGISFGIDRIYEVMNESDSFENMALAGSTTKVLFAHFGEVERNYCLSLAKKLRVENINTEIYPDVVKIKKQFDYANRKQIPFVIVVGEDEMKSGQLTLKNMKNGEQWKLSFEEIMHKKNLLFFEK